MWKGITSIHGQGLEDILEYVIKKRYGEDNDQLRDISLVYYYSATTSPCYTTTLFHSIILVHYHRVTTVYCTIAQVHYYTVTLAHYTIVAGKLLLHLTSIPLHHYTSILHYYSDILLLHYTSIPLLGYTITSLHQYPITLLQ